MTLEKMKPEDLPAVMEIIGQAQQGLREQGVDQWQNGYPSEAVFQDDIDAGYGHVIREEGEIVGTAAVIYDGEPDYAKIYDGAWLSSRTYAVIHRIAVRQNQKRNGSASFVIAQVSEAAAEAGCSSIRMDTHRDNLVMQKFLQKNGFQYCGLIYLADGEERFAYEKLLACPNKKILSLDGVWELRRCNIGEYNVDEIEKLPAIPCRVPGAVHMALLEAGEIAEPLIQKNMEKCRWIEEKDFWHTLKFDVTKEFCCGQAVLSFDGVDINASYYLNGKMIGESENAFREIKLDVTGMLHQGENTLTVRVNEGVQAVKNRGKSIEYMKNSWNQQEPYRTYLRKPQFCYGWDWAQRLSTCGIYRSVRLVADSRPSWKDIFLTNKIVDEKDAAITFAYEIEEYQKKPEDRELRYKIHCRIYSDRRYEEEKLLYSGEMNPEADREQVMLPDVRQWWCNGYGEQYLYHIIMDIISEDGIVLDRKELKYGVRSIRIEQKEIGTNGDKTFTFILNNKPIYAKGANWVPVDQIIGRIDKNRYEKLVLGAADMNMNMFRVWGGGFYEGDEFFDLCDQYGILVWHDFMFACGYYPDFDEEFVENVRLEAEYQIRHKRNRACFVGWSGNNENYTMYEGQQQYIKEPFPFYGKKIYEEVLAPACARLDPEREYRVSSPYGGTPCDSGKEGDQHYWGTYHDFTKIYRDFFRIADEKASFLSEFGMIAPMNVESLKKCCDKEEWFPQSDQWKFHSNTGDDFEQVLRQYFKVEEPAKELGLEQYILMGQAVQAEVIRYAFEKYRTEKFLCSGTLFWMYSDCFPTSGWCFLDYYFNRKPLYYYTKRAFAPVHPVFTGFNPNTLSYMQDSSAYLKENGKIGLSIVNDRLEQVKVTGEVIIEKLDGTVIDRIAIAGEVPANGVCSLAEIDVENYLRECSADEMVLLCDLGEGHGTVEYGLNRCFLVPYSELKLEKTEIVCRKTQKDGYVELKISADRYIWLCHLPHKEGQQFDQNDFDIPAGREITVKLYGCSAMEYEFACLSMNDCLSKANSRS